MSARLFTLLAGGLLLAGCSSTPEKPGDSESRTLAAAEVAALQQGQGMGMAAVAEINGYPGPKHVLDLKEELELTPDQRFATSRLLGVTQGQARALGQRIVDAERELDVAMAEGELSREQVRQRIQNIASLRAQLRHTHIDAHLQQKKILTPEQVVRYYELRGRKVHVPAPAVPAAVTEPITLPVDAEPAVAPAAEMPTTSDSPATPAPSVDPAPVIVPVPALAPTTEDEPEVESEAFEAEEPAPLPATAAPAAEPRELTPGMRDALDAGPTEMLAPETSGEDVLPLPPPEQQATEQPLIEEEEPTLPPPAAAEPKQLTPGMRDALDAGPTEMLAPETSGEDVLPLPPPEREEQAPEQPLREEEPALPPSTPAEPKQLTPGMRDALDAGPTTPQAEVAAKQAPPPPPTAKPSSPQRPAGAAPSTDRKNPDAPVVQESGKLTPGMRDALEFAEPREETEEEADVYIEPLDDSEDPPPLPPTEPGEPVMIDLDN